MKTTLLQMVQSILNDMESESVDSIDDTHEATMIANTIEDVYYDLIVPRFFAAHYELIKLTPLSDTNFPTHFTYSGTKSVDRICLVRYDVDDSGGTEPEYKEIHWKDPLEFLTSLKYNSDGTTDTVNDKNGGTKLFIGNDAMPSYYTSFDNKHVVMDSYDSTIESTLQESKIQAYGRVIPDFTISDSFVPDLDDMHRPYFLSECKTRCFDLYKGGPPPTVVQAARRNKSYIQNDRYKTTRENSRPKYGR